MQKIQNKFLFIFALLFVFTLTGCTNSDENLENYYYVMAIGIDSSETTEINLSIQIASNSEQSNTGSGSSQSSSSNIYTVPCNSIDSGVSIFNNYLSKKINLSHCSAIIVSEDLAKKGIKTYINTLANNPEIRPTCNIIISSTSSLDALEKISNSNENFSAKFYEFIKNSTKYTGYSITPELSEFFYCINYGTNSSIATYALLSDDTIQNTGIAVFNNEYFITNLSVLDAVSYSIITNRLESSTISVKNPQNSDQLIDVLIKQIKTPSIQCSLVNNYPFIQINLSIEYDILSSSYDLNTDNFRKNELLEQTITSYIQEMILSFLYKVSHEYQIDICNFQNEFIKQYLTLEDFEKIHWSKIYKDSYFDVVVTGKIENSGMFSKN